MTAEMAYGALSAKVRALYGKRLRSDDFARLAARRSEAEILDELRQHPGWSRALALVPPGAWGYVGRVEVERALQEELRLEYQSLAYYVPREAPPPPRIALHSRLDEAAAAACTTYDQLTEAARDTIYYSALRQLRPPRTDELPDFTRADAVLRTAYYAHLLRIVRSQYQGRTQKVLLRAIGEQIDLLNILHILRLKTYFPQTSREDYAGVLFPFQYRLTMDFLRRLCEAPGAEGAYGLLRESPYGDCFDETAVDAVEEYYQRAVFRFNKRQLSAVPPSIYTAIAYLELKELELGVLVNVIESVKYGVPYHAEFANLVGG